MTRRAANEWMRARGRGAALLAVLVLVALMAVIATLMLDRLNLATRLAANSQAMAQARIYAASVEQVTLARLTQLVAMDEDKTVDRINLLGRETVLPLGRGSAMVMVEDASNCFNVNAMGAGRDGNGGRFDTPARNQFVRLMEGLQVPSNDAQAIADSLGDWVDEDGNVRGGGAEDDYYLGLPTPYRTPNRAIVELSELRSIKGMSEPIYRRLYPWLCALPTGDDAKVNVNTLRPDQARLIAAMSPGLDVNRARAFIASRPETGWNSMSEALGMMARGDNAVFGAGALRQMAIKSEMFTIRIRVMVDNIELTEVALVDATQEGSRVIARSWGEQP
ncbi:type II secretion system minor pseudopilin GspK [Croceicoccus mobilis]|uniref:Type II secretion system protein K n=1 Tax=Croceicoccus mobilis TaxID=1703339 RepID=A0A916Z2S4_9SPHN|nr:type II secretion system minor pseudopilin GspK [Croceicoccus mobilis]GGD73005.1 type II secretion system protein K [Croceicoccus mobilis]